jgi:hypothetical protein
LHCERNISLQKWSRHFHIMYSNVDIKRHAVLKFLIFLTRGLLWILLYSSYNVVWKLDSSVIFLLNLFCHMFKFLSFFATSFICDYRMYLLYCCFNTPLTVILTTVFVFILSVLLSSFLLLLGFWDLHFCKFLN